MRGACKAVARKGDDAILRALEEAVEVIGKNTQLLLEHFVPRRCLQLIETLRLVRVVRVDSLKKASS